MALNGRDRVEKFLSWADSLADEAEPIHQRFQTYASELPFIRERGVGEWASQVGDAVLNPRRPPLVL